MKDNARQSGFFPEKCVRRKILAADRTESPVSPRAGCGRTLFHAALKGDAGEHQTKALLANFSHTIVHAVDPVTAEWAAKKLGRCRETFFGGSSAPPEDMFDALFGPPKLTSSFSEQYENVLQENVFQNGLRTGGPANRFLCDAIVLRSGEPFARASV